MRRTCPQPRPRLPSPVPAPKPQAAPVPQPELAELKPAAVSVVPAVVPVRVLSFDPPESGGLAGLKVGPVTFTPYGFIKATARARQQFAQWRRLSYSRRSHVTARQ